MSATGRCTWCMQRDSYLAEAERLVNMGGLHPAHPLVKRQLGRAQIAGLRANHPINLANECPHETREDAS